eukprot:g45573.t1
MASDDFLDVGAGEMVVKAKGNPIAFAGGKRMGESGSAGDGSDPVEGPVDNGTEKSSVEEGGGHFGGSLVELGLIGTYGTEMEEMKEWDGVFTGSRQNAGQLNYRKLCKYTGDQSNLIEKFYILAFNLLREDTLLKCPLQFFLLLRGPEICMHGIFEDWKIGPRRASTIGKRAKDIFTKFDRVSNVRVPALRDYPPGPFLPPGPFPPPGHRPFLPGPLLPPPPPPPHAHTEQMRASLARQHLLPIPNCPESGITCRPDQ